MEPRRCERALRHYAKTIRDLETFKHEGGPLITDKDRADADQIIQAFRPYVAAVTVHANEAGATWRSTGRRLGWLRSNSTS